ncbi:myotrophin-like [Sycon ciliatum]|uniref:myotrophin-like n=1 Tax=Sycon ciliatum TaxID=27933 RepID=UPI0020AA7376|eukprot:scpid93076/ scgid13877/ Myotrophin
MSDDLLWAVKNGDLEQVKSLSASADVNAVLKNGRMALHYAADFGQAEVIEYLLSIGANVDLADSYGITPLLAAIYEGHLECVQLLVKKGANKSLKSPDGRSYAECAEDDEIRQALQ